MQVKNFAHLASQRQPMLGQAPHCGDGVWTCWHGRSLFAFLCDGAGHGVEAEAVQQQALELTQSIVETCESIDLVALFGALHSRLRGSRGMVAVALILHEDGKMEFLHIGDVSLFSVQTGAADGVRSTEQQGIIGYHMPTPRVQQWQCQPGQWLVMHSDGIRRSTTIAQWQRLLQPARSMQSVSLNIMRELADGRDDAACIVLRYLGVQQVLNLAAERSVEGSIGRPKEESGEQA